VTKYISEEEKHYFLKCKVHIVKVCYEDYQSKGNLGTVEEDMVFLEPEINTEATRFYNAWLPDSLEEAAEIGISMGYPVFGMFRACVRRFHKDFKRPHIFVMSRGAEEIFKHLKLKNIEVEVMGASEEEALDAQKDFDLASKKVI